MSGTPTDPMDDQVEEYALGLLAAPERVQFEARLASDPGLRRQLAETMDALGTLAFATPVEPAPELKARVMARVAAGAGDARVLPFVAPTASRSRMAAGLGVGLAASLLIVAGLARELRDARGETRKAQQVATASAAVVAQRDSLIAALTDPATELVTLAATGGAKPVVKAYVNRTRRTMLLSAALLETLPTGRAYQLWFIVDGKPIPSVTFNPDSGGKALLQGVPLPAGAIAAAAVTEEPAGGSQAPTTKPIFVGKLATE